MRRMFSWLSSMVGRAGFGRAAAVILASLVIVLGAPAIQAQVDAPQRIALVIGNSAYQNVPALKNPGNDSSDLAEALESVGFEVLLHTDQTQATMLDTLRSFRRQATGAEIALIYYAGHGIEIDRQNYLIPVDAVLETDSDVNFETVRLETMMFAASGATELSMVIVDACRDNPFATSMQRSSSSRSIGRGLSAVEPTQNTLVAYAAKEGTTAADGAGRNSPYASALIKALQEPQLEIGLMMRQVRDHVLDVTGGQQEPFVYGSLSAQKIYLNETRGLTPVRPEAPTPGADADAVEIAYWQSVSQSSRAVELENYLARYPDGVFADLARSRIASLRDTAPEEVDPFKPLVPAEDIDEAKPEIEPDRALTRTEIVEVQERLSALGHSLGRADGIPGRRTQAAIREYEADLGIPTTGEVGLRILSALRETVSDEKLAEWRAREASRVRTTAPTTQQTRPNTNTATRAPAQTPDPAEEDTARAPSTAFSKFCQSNAQCATRECRGGGSKPIWRKSRRCQFCPQYVNRCE